MFNVREAGIAVYATDLPAHLGTPPIDLLMEFSVDDLNDHWPGGRRSSAAAGQPLSIFDEPNLNTALSGFMAWNEENLKWLLAEATARWNKMQIPIQVAGTSVPPNSRIHLRLLKNVTGLPMLDPGIYTYLGFNVELTPPRVLLTNADNVLFEVPWPPESFPWHDAWDIELVAP